MSAPCQSTGSEQAPARPWRDDPRADAKDGLLRYAVDHREGITVATATRDVLGAEADGSGDHRLALRFYRTHPALFRTDRRDGLVWAWPTPEACRLLNHE